MVTSTLDGCPAGPGGVAATRVRPWPCKHGHDRLCWLTRWVISTGPSCASGDGLS